jgi:hypothetical protein
MKLATPEQMNRALDTIFRDVGGAGFLMKPVPKGTPLTFRGGPLDEARMVLPAYLPEFRWRFDRQHEQLDQLVLEYVAVYWPSFFTPNCYVLHAIGRVGSHSVTQVWAPADAKEGLVP